MAPAPLPPLPPIDGAAPTIVHLCGEYYPYARTGGLAEAAWGLHREQHRQGLATAAIMPLYRTARVHLRDLEEVGPPWTLHFGSRAETFRLWRDRDPASGTPTWFIDHPGYFDRDGIYAEWGADYPDNHLRYAAFAAAAVSALPRLTSGPVLLHAHDWHSALAPVYLRWWWQHDPWFARIPTVLSVHNGGYQGHFSGDIMPDLGLPWSAFRYDRLEWYGKTNYLKGGLTHADQVTTVSPSHARELRTPEGGFGLQEVYQQLGNRFTGILNGIDTTQWDPARESGLAVPFTPDDLSGKQLSKRRLQERLGLPVHPLLPLIAMAGRMVTQKGLDLIIDNPALFELPGQFVFLGSGERRFEEALRRLAEAMPHRIAVETQFSDPLEHALMAGADLFLMPSQYEPCGLTQMRAQRYGTLPVARRVGGLADTIEDGSTGFLFDAFTPDAMIGALWRAQSERRAAGAWRGMQRDAMLREFGWDTVAVSYQALYQRAIQRRAERTA